MRASRPLFWRYTHRFNVYHKACIFALIIITLPCGPNGPLLGFFLHICWKYNCLLDRGMSVGGQRHMQWHARTARREKSLFPQI